MPSMHAFLDRGRRLSASRRSRQHQPEAPLILHHCRTVSPSPLEDLEDNGAREQKFHRSDVKGRAKSDIHSRLFLMTELIPSLLSAFSQNSMVFSASPSSR